MQMLCSHREALYGPRAQVWGCLILSVLFPLLREAANGSWIWLLLCVGAAPVLCHHSVGLGGTLARSDPPSRDLTPE